MNPGSESNDMYVITGATSNTGGAVANNLLDRGAKVRVIGRSLPRLRALIDRGAEPYLADPSDRLSMQGAFEGASGAWIMLQPNYIADSQDFRGYQDTLIDSIVPSLEMSSVRHVVSLSSWGADREAGTGPVVGLHRLEQRLNLLANINVLHLRAGYFMENSLPFVDQLLTGNTVYGPFRETLPLPMVSTRDIGAAAAAHLEKLDFEGHDIRELQGERTVSMSELLDVIGRALDRPKVSYSQTSAEDAVSAMLSAGISSNVAGLMMEVVHGINSEWLTTTSPRSERTTTPTSCERFVQEQWLPAYQAKIRALI